MVGVAAGEAGRNGGGPAPPAPPQGRGQGDHVGAVVRYQEGTLWRANEVLLHSVCAGAPCIVIL